MPKIRAIQSACRKPGAHIYLTGGKVRHHHFGEGDYAESGQGAKTYAFTFG